MTAVFLTITAIAGNTRHGISTSKVEIPAVIINVFKKPPRRQQQSEISFNPDKFLWRLKQFGLKIIPQRRKIFDFSGLW